MHQSHRWKVEERDRFSARQVITERAIKTFARAAGDRNPLHRDARYASQTRFGRVIASGAHTSSLLMGLVATHFSRLGSMVGLEFAFWFYEAVPCHEPVMLEWLVVRVTETSGRGARIVELRGRLRMSDGTTAVGAKGTVLVAGSL